MLFHFIPQVSRCFVLLTDFSLQLQFSSTSITTQLHSIQFLLLTTQLFQLLVHNFNSKRNRQSIRREIIVFQSFLIPFLIFVWIRLFNSKIFLKRKHQRRMADQSEKSNDCPMTMPNTIVYSTSCKTNGKLIFYKMAMNLTSH